MLDLKKRQAKDWVDLNIVSLLSCVSNMKRIRKKKLLFQFFQVIESDPEDDLLEQATRPKYSRGPEMMSTPTYSMDTDISTLEAPTFSTLNKGPSQTMMSLRWDHQVNEMGRRVSLLLQSNPTSAIRNFLVALKLFLNAKSSLSL